MYPNEIIFGMTLYEIFLAIGIVAALAIARIFSDIDKVPAKLFNFILIDGCVAIALGYFGAVFTQAIYNWLDDGVFELTVTTGATFLGGLIAGVVIFLIGYFIIGSFLFKKKENIKYFPRLLDFAPVSITAAHAFGRLGCLMAGCCHGEICDAWYAVYHVNLGAKAVPIQLFESIFLFILCAVLTILAIKKVSGTMAIYMSSYGMWRFFVEYLRSDDRGSTVVDFLTPSQLISVLLLIGSVLILLYSLKMRKYSWNVSEVENEEN